MKARSIVPIAIVLCSSLASTQSADPAAINLLPAERPGMSLPIVREHTYKMAGRVRALLLWISRDDVGTGLIRWRTDADSIAYELLIGSDPLRAPIKLNRWGYLAEEVSNGECAVVGIMSKSSEDGLGEVKRGAKTEGGLPFDSIRGRVTANQAFAQVAILQARGGVTYRDAEEVLGMVMEDRPEAVKRIDRPSGVRPGFLSSVAEIIRKSVESHARGQRLPPQTLPYVYGDRLYELRLLEAAPLARFEREGRVYEQVIRGKFETGRAGRAGNRFELVYGTSGPLAEIPILISYQPKWWLQVELAIQ